MVPFIFSADVTAYFRVHQVDDRFLGLVDLLHGRQAVRVEHRCAHARQTEAEAMRDARRDASALLRDWRAAVRREQSQ